VEMSLKKATCLLEPQQQHSVLGVRVAVSNN